MAVPSSIIKRLKISEQGHADAKPVVTSNVCPPSVHVFIVCLFIKFYFRFPFISLSKLELSKYLIRELSVWSIQGIFALY